MEILPRVKIQYPMKNRYKYRRVDARFQNFSMNRQINPMASPGIAKYFFLHLGHQIPGNRQAIAAYLIFTCAVSVTMICGLSR